MGIIEEIVAAGLTDAWSYMTPEQKNGVRTGTVAGEKALEKFNAITLDNTVDPEELEMAIRDLLEAVDSTTGRAIQAYLWSLFKSN
jgi:hypothetical protein